MTNTINDIARLKADGVTLEQISEELDYRGNAAEGSRWDDDLYEYSTEELTEIEIAWETKQI